MGRHGGLGKSAILLGGTGFAEGFLVVRLELGIRGDDLLTFGALEVLGVPVLLQRGDRLALDRLGALAALGSKLEQVAGFAVRLAFLLEELLVLADQRLSAPGAHKMVRMPVSLHGGNGLTLHNLSAVGTLIIVGHGDPDLSDLLYLQLRNSQTHTPTVLH